MRCPTCCAVRLRGAVFFYLKSVDPWVAETPPSREAGFSRAFKRAVGESPGAWRRARRAGLQGRAAPTATSG
jgi:hypothetical protein